MPDWKKFYAEQRKTKDTKMTKHLKITVLIPVAEDPFEQAKTLVNVDPMMVKLKEDVAALGGQMAHEMVGMRAPRAAKAPAAEVAAEVTGEDPTV